MQPTRPTPASRLRAAVADGAENRPGVYRFVGPRGEVLYVGKSIRIRTRLLSYFRGEKGSREAELLRTASGIEWDYVPNEFEALLRELRLIRSFRPRFNVRHRRERRFAWIRITGHAAPKLVATRSPRPDGSRHFGPFPAGRDLPRTLRELAIEAQLRDCPENTPIRFADQMDLLGAEHTAACIRAELGSCPGPCAALCSEAEYRGRVDRAIAFLAGTSDELTGAMRDRLARLAGAREYEHAARLRDRIERLDRLRAEVGEFERYLGRLHFVYSVAGGDRRLRHYLILNGRVRLTFRNGRSSLDRIRKIVREPDPGPTSLSASQREELFLVVRWFRRRPEELDRTRPVEEFLRSEGRRALSPPERASGSPRTPLPAPAAPTTASASREPSPRAPGDL